MNDKTDPQLLRAYAENRSEAAFAELVRRHVDFVYSTGRRMVCDPHLAEDVTQGVFLALAKNAGQLTNRAVLSGWLHRTAQNIAAQTVRTIERRRAREQEAVAMNELLSSEPNTVWENIAPHFDAALGELNELDRDALLLRYFEKKSAQEMAEVLGISDDAAQKRVSRAVERLREFFAKRGITVGASALSVVISTNAVQAAPAGLAAAASTAATLIGTTLTSSTTAIAMTALQKSIITATIAVLAGAGIYEARQATQLGDRVRTLQQQQAPLAAQVQQLSLALIDATNQFAALRDDNTRLNRNTPELLRLRSESTRLKADSEELARLKNDGNDPTEAIARTWLKQVNILHQRYDELPERKVPELQFLTKKDWFEAANDADLTTDEGLRKAMSDLRSMAKGKFASMMGGALKNYAQAHEGRLPATVAELKPHFVPPVDDAILRRYQMLQAGTLSDTRGKYQVNEIAPVDEAYDTRYYISTGSSMGAGVETYSPTNLINMKYPPLTR